MEFCVACRRRIWLWQRTGFNSSWHKRCATVWEKGYEVAHKFCTNENKIHGLPTPSRLYRSRGPVGEMKSAEGYHDGFTQNVKRNPSEQSE